MCYPGGVESDIISATDSQPWKTGLVSTGGPVGKIVVVGIAKNQQTSDSIGIRRPLCHKRDVNQGSGI